MTVVELIRTLRSEDPRVFVAADDAPEGRFAVNPMCLDDAQAEYVVERISAAVEN